MSADAVIDTSIVTAIIAVIKEVIGMFSIFPLNIFLVCAIISAGIGIFARLRRTSK